MKSPDRIAALSELLSTPYRGPLVWVRPVIPALLRLEPMFDPVRNVRASKNSSQTNSRNSKKLTYEQASFQRVVKYVLRRFWFMNYVFECGSRLSLGILSISMFA